jgi:protein gp37
VRFISAEPLLEDISQKINLDGFGWGIAGGESGTGPEYLWDPTANWREEFNTGGRRTMELSWAQNLLTKFQEKNLPYWFKQITSFKPGRGEDALGKIYHQVPAPPFGRWAEKEKEESMESPLAQSTVAFRN